MVRCETTGTKSFWCRPITLTFAGHVARQSEVSCLVSLQDQPLEVPSHDEARRKSDHVRLRRLGDVDQLGLGVTSDVEIPPGCFRMNVVHDGPWPPLRKWRRPITGSSRRQAFN